MPSLIDKDHKPMIHLGISEPEGKQQVVSDPFIHRRQRHHYLWANVLPFACTIAAFALLPVFPVGWPEGIAFLVMWAISGLGLTAGFHRLFAHNSYTAGPHIRSALAVAGSMGAVGNLTSWVAIHRRHHHFADREGDIHSPNLRGPRWRDKLRGFQYAYSTWMFEHPYPNPAYYVPDIIRNPHLCRISRRYPLWVFLGVAIPAVACALTRTSWSGLVSGFLWGGMVRLFVLQQGTSWINSFCHLFGSRRFDTDDLSRNIGCLAPFVFGESWHNNHHAFPGSASFGLRWYCIDPGFWFIRIISLLGLAGDITVPNQKQIEARTV